MMVGMGREVGAAADTEGEFYQLYNRESTLVLRYLRAAVPDQTVAEDLCADTFFRAWGSWLRFHGDERAARAWLMRIARNRLIDHLRGNKRMTFVSIGSEDPADPRGVAALDHVLLQHALQRLKRQDLDLMAMRLAGLSHKEIAAVRGGSEEATKKAWRRTLDRVRAELEVTL